MKENYDIDGNTLKALLRLNGYNAKQVSMACGLNPTYLSVCINRKRMTLANARVLESVTGIPLEAYAIPPEAREAPKRTVGRPKKPMLDYPAPPCRATVDTETLTKAVRDALGDERTVRALAASLLRIALEGLK